MERQYVTGIVMPSHVKADTQVKQSLYSPGLKFKPSEGIFIAAVDYTNWHISEILGTLPP